MSPYFGIVVLLVIAAGFVALTIVTSVLVGPGRYNRAKYDSYECGIEPTPQPVGGGRFPVKYYITAMLFIVFDIEIVFLYPVGGHLRSDGHLRARRDGLVYRHGVRGLLLRAASGRAGLGLRC